MENLEGGAERGEDIATPEVERQHFDDFELADLALRGALRLREREKGKDGDWGNGDFEEAEYGNNGGLGKDVNDTHPDDTEEDFDDEEDFYGYDDYDDYEDYEDYEDYDDEDARTEELEREQKFELLTIPEEILAEYDLPKDLPQGVCVMGGTARSLARRLVAGDREPVRDLDLVYIEDLVSPEEEPDQSELDRISEKYMPDDFLHGHGIQRESMENYFQTRDLTINQCLIVGDQLLMTRAAYDDLQENIIRPSYYEKPLAGQYCGDRLLMRALLLQAVLQEATESYPILEDFEMNDDTIVYLGDTEREKTVEFPVSDFQKAISLNKAMSRGAKIARNFTENLAEWGTINSRFVDKPMALARFLNTRLERPFVYRPLDETEAFRDDDSDDADYHNNLEELEPGLIGYTSNDPAVRQAIREYDSTPSRAYEKARGLSETPREPTSGSYFREDYEWINTI